MDNYGFLSKDVVSKLEKNDVPLNIWNSRYKDAMLSIAKHCYEEHLRDIRAFELNGNGPADMHAVGLTHMIQMVWKGNITQCVTMASSTIFPADHPVYAGYAHLIAEGSEQKDVPRPDAEFEEYTSIYNTLVSPHHVYVEENNVFVSRYDLFGGVLSVLLSCSAPEFYLTLN